MSGRPGFQGRWRTWAGLALVALVVVSLAALLVPLLDQRSPDRLDAVPERADAVAHVDPKGLSATQSRQRISLNAIAYQDDHPFYRGPRVHRWTRTFITSDHVRFDRARGLTFFVDLDANLTRNASYGAVIVDAPWSEAALVRTVEAEANVSLRRTERAGRPVYVPRSGAGPFVAPLNEDETVVGDRAAVLDALAVESGDAEPLARTFRERFRRARSGYVTVAYPFPHDVVPDLPSVVGRGFTHSQVVTGVYYANQTAPRSRLGAQFALHTNDSDAAENLAATVGLGLRFYASNTPDPVLERAAKRVRIHRRGRTVLLVYEAPQGRVETLVDRLRA